MLMRRSLLVSGRMREGGRHHRSITTQATRSNQRKRRALESARKRLGVNGRRQDGRLAMDCWGHCQGEGCRVSRRDDLCAKRSCISKRERQHQWGARRRRPAGLWWPPATRCGTAVSGGRWGYQTEGCVDKICALPIAFKMRPAGPARVDDGGHFPMLVCKVLQAS